MRIVVNHLTRMAPGYICVAGIETETGNHVRPVLRSRLESTWSSHHGGPFDIGEIIDLGTVIHAGQRPEVEDWQFQGPRLGTRGRCEPDDFWQLLHARSHGSLRDIFGPELHRTRQTWSTAEGAGIASLGILEPVEQPSLFVNDGGRLRLALYENGLASEFPVTDLRFYDADYNLREDVVHNVCERMERSTPLLLSVGLTRPWQKRDTSERRHWVQINNIHLEDDPAWPLIHPGERIRKPMSEVAGTDNDSVSRSVWDRIRTWLKVG